MIQRENRAALPRVLGNSRWSRKFYVMVLLVNWVFYAIGSTLFWDWLHTDRGLSLSLNAALWSLAQRAVGEPNISQAVIKCLSFGWHFDLFDSFSGSKSRAAFVKNGLK